VASGGGWVAWRAPVGCGCLQCAVVRMLALADGHGRPSILAAQHAKTRPPVDARARHRCFRPDENCVAHASVLNLRPTSVRNP